MKKFITVFLVLIAGIVGLSACSVAGASEFASDSAELYTARAEVVDYLVEEGEIAEEEAEQDLYIYCQRIGDCSFGTGICDGTGAGKCAALGLTAEQIAEYVEQRQAQLDACVNAGLMTQEEADLCIQLYAEKLEKRAGQLNGYRQNGKGVCGSQDTCSGVGNGNRYRKGRCGN